MCKLFTRYEREIEQYCNENGLDFDTAKKLPQCWGRNDIWLQYHDPQKGAEGLRDETPAPVVLIIRVHEGTVSFEQTEYTERYLKKPPESA